jgi:uncharacterized protein YybS (DUF2232 family)
MRLVFFGAMALFLGYCFNTQRKALFTLGGTTMLAVVGMAVQIGLAILVTGLPATYLIDNMRLMFEYFAYGIEAQGTGEAVFGGMTAEEYVELMMLLLERLLPSLLIMAALFMALCCYLVFRKVMRHLGYQTQNLPPFIEWRLGRFFKVLLIIALFSLILGAYLELDVLVLVGENLIYFCLPIFIIIGIAIIFWLLKHLEISPFVKFMLAIFSLVMFAIMFYMVLIVGFLDMFIDFRTRIQRRWPVSGN